jgi:pimeloyl-ACP methyl ester carboxylesterase
VEGHPVKVPRSETKPYADRYLTVRDGLRLHYRDYPGFAERPPLLCLHGLTRNARDFEHLAERYAGRFRVLALEFRGRAESDYDPKPSRYTPLVYAGDVLQLLDELALPQAIFVGTSLGGLVTMTVAAMAPQRIAAAILNDVGPELSNEGLDRIKTYVGNDVRFASWDEAARALAANNRNVPAAYTHGDWLKMARRNCRERDGEIVFDYDIAIAEPFNRKGAAPTIDLWPLFAVLARKPLLLIRGELSDLLSASAASKMKQAAPDMRVAVAYGVGHAPELNEPEAVQAIDEFLAGFAAKLRRADSPRAG